MTCGPEHPDDYVTTKLGQGLAPKTVTNHLATLDLVWKVAKRWRRIHSNPLDDVDRPRTDDPATVILTEHELGQLVEAYKLLAFEAEPVEAVWWDLARRMTLVVLGTALRWSDVSLLERRLHVRRAWVRNEMKTPKSRASRRTVEFGLKTKAALGEQWAASRYRHADDLVFGHPELGTPLDPSELTRSYVKPGSSVPASQSGSSRGTGSGTRR